MVPSQAQYTLAAGTKRLLHIWLVNEGTDFPLDVLDYADYDALPAKDTEGVPLYARVNYTSNPPTIDMYPVPDAQYEYTYRRQKLFDSITANTEEIDFPQAGLDMIIKGLGYSLSKSHRLSLEERALLEMDYRTALTLFMSNNTERHGQEIVQPKGVIIV
jgi:hypothetical protein